MDLIEAMARGIALRVSRNGTPIRLTDTEEDCLWQNSAMRDYFIAQARAALTAAEAAGWKMVPVDAIRDAWLSGFAATAEGWNGEYPLGEEAQMWCEAEADKYVAAMLAASPAVE